MTQKIGDYYAACMDEKAIDAKGLAPLQPELGRIRDLKDKSQLAEEIAHLHRNGVSALFEFGSGQDFKDSSAVIAQADQGGLGLPDRDYYLKDDAKSVELRQSTWRTSQRMFELAGETPRAGQGRRGHRDEDRNGPGQGLARPGFAARSREGLPQDEQAGAGLAQPRVSAGTCTSRGAARRSFRASTWPGRISSRPSSAEIQSASLPEWKTYLTWHLLHSEAPLLPTAFVEENFNFYGKTLTGAKEMRPRWKRCVDFTDAQLGEALGRKFVERTFGAEGKERTLKMVDALEKALGQDIEKLPWMTPATRQQALVKLKAITNKIGYPDKWRDYSSVAIERDDAIGNGFRADQFEFQRQLDKIGKPVDRGEWEHDAAHRQRLLRPANEQHQFPGGNPAAAFLRQQDGRCREFRRHRHGDRPRADPRLRRRGPPVRRPGQPQGLVDRRGRQGVRRARRLHRRRVLEFLPGRPDAHVNGKLTLGENTADNGGVRIALMALLNTIGASADKKIDGFTPEQRFFLSFGQIWCDNEREEAVRLQVQTNPHSPPKFRVNGVVENMPEFQKAFSCKAGQPMVAANACRVW